MANLSSINFKNNKVLLSVDVSKEEYQTMYGESDLLLLPVSSLDISLTTGTLGNSNRIMLPNKILKKNNIETLIKNVPSKIVKTKKGKYLIIQLEGPEYIPKFME